MDPVDQRVVQARWILVFFFLLFVSDENPHIKSVFKKYPDCVCLLQLLL